MRKSIAAAVIAATALTSACHRGRSEDAGPTVSRNYQIGNFHQIEVAGSYDVEVRTGANPGVSARGSQKLLERTIVEVHGDRLVIHPQENHSFFHFGWSHNGNASFVVTVPQLTGAAIAGSGGIKVNQVSGDSFEGSVAGSGDLEVATLDVKSLKLSIAGSGGVKAGAGKTANAEYEIAGSGDIDAGAVTSQQLKVSIAGSGNVKAHATGAAEVDIMGSGDAEITGGAKCSVSKTGSGDAHCS
jgi:hypothetical protein